MSVRDYWDLLDRQGYIDNIARRVHAQRLPDRGIGCISAAWDSAERGNTPNPDMGGRKLGTTREGNLYVLCWCGSRIVDATPEEVRAGITHPCRNYCGPGTLEEKWRDRQARTKRRIPDPRPDYGPHPLIFDERGNWIPPAQRRPTPPPPPPTPPKPRRYIATCNGNTQEFDSQEAFTAWLAERRADPTPSPVYLNTV